MQLYESPSLKPTQLTTVEHFRVTSALWESIHVGYSLEGRLGRGPSQPVDQVYSEFGVLVVASGFRAQCVELHGGEYFLPSAYLVNSLQIVVLSFPSEFGSSF